MDTLRKLIEARPGDRLRAQVKPRAKGLTLGESRALLARVKAAKKGTGK